MNIYQLIASMHNQSGYFAECTFHYQLSESGSFDPFEYAQHLIAAWQTNNEVNFLKVLGGDMVLDFYTARRISGGGGTSAQLIVGSPGTALTSCSSISLAADIAWECNAASNRLGHTFLPAVPQGGLAGDLFLSGFITDVGNFITDMLTQLTLIGGAGNADFGLYTRKTQQFNKAKQGILRPKATALNKRTLPVV